MGVLEAVKRFGGFSLSAWAHVLRTHFPEMRGRLTASGARTLVALTLCGAATSALSMVDALVHGWRTSATPVPNAPLFVLGYFRSGTTMAINAVASNARHVSCVPLFVGYFPNTCFLLRPLRFVIAWLWLRELREGDQVHEGVDSPCEEDHALLLMSGSGTYGQTLFLTASTSGTAYRTHVIAAATPPEQARFFQGLDLLMRRAVAYNALGDPRAREKCLCLKSCSQTCRVLALAQRYPGARFVYVHRHPYAVYRSMMPHLRSWDLQTTMDDADDKTLREATLEWYSWFLQSYLEQRAALPQGTRLIEISYDELTHDTEGTMLRVFSVMGIPVDRAALSAHCEGLRGYRRNAHPPLSAAEKALVRERWAAAFEAFGYSTEEDGR